LEGLKGGGRMMNRIIKVYFKLMPYLAFLWILVCVANGIHSMGDIWHLIKPILLGYLERKIEEWVKK